MTEPPVRISSQLIGDARVVTVSGEVDLSNAHHFYDQTSAAILRADRAVVIDLDGLAYMDSAGLKVLIRLADNIRRCRQNLALVASTSGVARRLLDVTGLTGAFPCHASIDAAIADTGADPSTP